MILSEVGYNQDDHDMYLAEIREQSLSISDAIIALVDLYQVLYNVDAYKINCGLCENFANDVVDLFPEAIADWGDSFISEEDDVDQYAYHCIIRYQNKFYDSQHPQGVDDFREISAFGIKSLKRKQSW